MGKIVVHLQTTLDGRIATADGTFWEPFPWGDVEQAWLNDAVRRADTWVFGRVMYDAVVPWWDSVAAGEVPADVAEVSAVEREFAALLHGMRKIVISRGLDATSDRTVIAGDLVPQLHELKRGEADILLSCGPTTLAGLAGAAGLIDEYLLAVHPAVITTGPRVFDGLDADLALELAEAKIFAGGAVVLRYRVVSGA